MRGSKSLRLQCEEHNISMATIDSPSAALSEVTRLLTLIDAELATLFALCGADFDSHATTSTQAVARRERVQSLFAQLQSLCDAASLDDLVPAASGAAPGAAPGRADVPVPLAQMRRQLQVAQRIVGLSASSAPPPPSSSSLGV
jgi:hypothetical protein